ncbi:MAG: phosphoribosyltransferase family protein [bacterium]|nr:phosphoribosyltransferase family protein [bacterium]
MEFRDRTEAGEALCQSLTKYKGKDVIVFALPRGGVITAAPIALFLNAHLDLLITRKIGHPSQPEYALAAIAENGDILVGNEDELSDVDQEWLRNKIKKEKKEAKRRREAYLAGRKQAGVKGKIAIIVDDGIATGLTIKAAIAAMKKKNPQKIVVAVPVAPEETISEIKKSVDDVVCLIKEVYGQFRGSVGAYYREFPQVTDDEVVKAMSDASQ